MNPNYHSAVPHCLPLGRTADAPPPASPASSPGACGGGAPASLPEAQQAHLALRRRIARAIGWQPLGPLPLIHMPKRKFREPLASYVKRVECMLFDRSRSADELAEILRGARLAKRRRARA